MNIQSPSASDTQISLPSAKTANMQLIVFEIAAQAYAIEIDQIREVVATPQISKIPLTAPYIKGVANVRGSILTLIDLEIRFGLNNTDQNPNELINQTHDYTLVIENADVKLGILVRQMPSTIIVGSEQIDNSMVILGQDSSGEGIYIKGIIRIEERMIILVDIHWIIAQYTKM